MDEIETENIAYLEDGSEVEVLQKTEHGVIVIRRYCGFDDDDDIWAGGDSFVVERVFDTPPVERKHESIAALQAREDELRKSIEDKRRELASIEVGENRIQELAAKDAALRRVCDFLEGKITHYVVCQYGCYELLEAAPGGGIPDIDGCGRVEGTRLLTLFGRSGKTVAWGLNRYSDGSGSNFDCEPFCGLEAATARLQEIVDDYESVQTHRYADLIRTAQAHSLIVPGGLTLAVAKAEIASSQHSVEVKRAELAAVEEKLLATVEKWGPAAGDGSREQAR